MRVPIYQVDAFTDRVFAGNPAAVCPLPSWLPDETLQHIARENNLSETAFTVPRDGGGVELRWFTPACEVSLCGHATLAAAAVLFRAHGSREPLCFHTRDAGVLTVSRDGEHLEMDFPAVPPEPGAVEDPALVRALGVAPLALRGLRSVHNARYVMAVLASPEAVATLRPDLGALRSLGVNVVVTAAGGGEGVDFVSRFFAPAVGVDEDPVTGSTHCSLAPYWAEVLGRPVLVGRQLSARGGTVGCAVEGDRVRLRGQTALYLRGEILIPD